MALPVGVTRLGSFKGEKGDSPSQAQLDATFAALIPAAVQSGIQSTGDGRLSDLGAAVSSTATFKDLDLLPAKSGWFRALSTALNRPPVTGAFSVLHVAYSATNAGQIAMSVSGTGEPATYVRVKRSDVWEPWIKLTTPGDVNTRVAGLTAELDLMVGVPEDEPARSPRTVVPMTFRDKTRNTFYPAIYPAIYPGVTWSGVARRRADIPVLRADGTLSPDVIPSIAPGVLTGLKVRATESGPLVLEVREDGKTYVSGVAITGDSDSGAKVKRVVVVAGLGQSNGVAHGQPIVPLLDGASDRIWQLPDGGSTLVPAVVPLTAPGETATGLAPSHVLAREIALRDPECVVVIVPAAKGGSGLVTDPAMGYGKWAIDYAGANPRLYTDAVAKMSAAFAQIAARWGLTPTVVTTWNQGEADGADGITGPAYQTALDALITDWVGRYGGLFLIAGMVPQVATSGTRPAITNVQEDTPRRVQSTAFVPGIDNGGGARGTADVIHYGREAIEMIGRAFYKAIPRASNNVTGSYTTPPVKVTATRWGNDVTVEWTPPYCRVSAYEVQSSPDGTTWTDVTVTEPVATTLAFASAVPVKVRVRAIGTGTSNWTAPVIAVGG